MELLIIFNNKKNENMAQTINAGQTLTANLVLWNTTTDQQVAGAYYTDVSTTSSDEAIATAAPKPNVSWQIDATGVSAGTATITVTATAHYEENGSPTSEAQTASTEITVPESSNELRIQF